ncbi:MAG: hypothetical protein IKN04_11855 [Clostridia bacterium]|nr:hypothetical protein [Clostridia bacterium]
MTEKHANGGEAAEQRKEPAVIRNRDIPLLMDILPTMQLVSETERRLDWQHDRMLSISQHISGMPGGGMLPKGLEDAFALLEDAGEGHEERVKQYVRELRKAERVLNGIESQSMRAFVVMKYVIDAPDAEIQRELNMSKWGFARARRSVEEAEDMESVVWREQYILKKDC